MTPASLARGAGPRQPSGGIRTRRFAVLPLRGRRRDAAATWESCQLVVTAGSSGDQLACLIRLGAALATRKVASGGNLTTRRSYDHAGVTEARERADEGLCKSIAFRQLPSCHDGYVT